MSREEALEWLRGNYSTINYIPQDPFETWSVRVAQADAAMAQRAYYIIKAYTEGLI